MAKSPAEPVPRVSPKSESVAGKNRAIILAARENFLRDGFAGASMDAIAKTARVSVKTIYGHFANKDQLFNKVMNRACTDNLLAGDTPSEETLKRRFAWFSQATQEGLFGAGREYLNHLLSEEEVALYRAVTRDAGRFPELGRQYQQTIARGRTGILIAYLRSLFRTKEWHGQDAVQQAATYEGLLRARIFEEVLHGLSSPSSDAIEQHARLASQSMWHLLAEKRG